MPYKNNRDKLFNAKRYRDELRMTALVYYSETGIPECMCCHESEIKFLAIDHINGGGTIHRKEIGTSNLVAWLRRNDYPEGFQVLCHNCNMAKGFYGVCPHKLRR